MSRRGNGEGTVFQRKDGLWQGQVTIPPSGLTPGRRVTRYGRTQRDVIAKLKSVRRSLEDGEPLTSRTPTLAEYGETFLGVTLPSEVARGKLRPATVRNYTIIWNTHIKPLLGHLRLADLTPALCREWSAGRATALSPHTGKPLAVSTQVRIYAVLRAALNYAVNDGVMKANPLSKVGQPTGRQKQVEVLTTEEFVAIMRKVEGTQLFTLLLLMSMTGARPGEALGASWQDIDLDTSRWFISRSQVRLPVPGRAGSRTTLGIAGTKTAASQATVRLPQVVVTALRAHRTNQLAQRMEARLWDDPDLVFTTPIGTLLEPRNVRRELKAAVTSCGITRQVRLHDMRHVAASSLLAEGIGLELVGKLLRHTRLSTTLEVYGHLMEETRLEAANAMDRRQARLFGS